MPSRHEKIREIVATVRRMRSVSMTDLVDDIDKRAAQGRCRPFVYRVTQNPRGQAANIPCKGPTIRRHVRFCRDLGLLVEDEQISLHHEIRNLKTAKAFDLALGTRLMEYMEKHGAGFDKIQKAITSEDVTDPHTIFGNVAPQGLSEEEFSSCLNLLATVSDEITAFQKKQYVLKHA
jgi:hypothetical protein